MSDNYVIRKGQSLLDITLQSYGSLSKLFDVALENGMGITDELHVSQNISVTSLDNIPWVAALIKKKNITIAASYGNTPQIGIGYYVIGNSFTIGNGS